MQLSEDDRKFLKVILPEGSCYYGGFSAKDKKLYPSLKMKSLYRRK